MGSSSTLQILNSREGYAAHFMDLDLWEPLLRKVCDRHRFRCGKVSSGVPGSFPTFIVEMEGGHGPRACDAVVVKFFGPLYGGLSSFSMERELGRWIDLQSLPIASPGILAEGQLNHDWYYLIFEYVAGMSLGQAWDKLSQDERINIACLMGEYTRCLHSITPDQTRKLPLSIQPALDRFTGFLRQQHQSCQTNHQAWKDLPAHLLDQLKGFVLPVDDLIDPFAPPHLIHADLTGDHLLGRMVSGKWQTLAIIDWGDAMTGNLLYELVALHLDLFHSDKQLLRACLEAYGLPEYYR
jgi:aminoglycoside phosphotransferase (APT) family kinase protein